MPSTFTGSGIELIADGEQSGVWGQTTNDNLQIINRLVSEAGSIALSGTTHTLTIADGSLSDGQYGVLVFGGAPSGTNTVTVSPNDAKRIFIVKNGTSESVVLTQGSGGNVTIPASAFKIVYTDGGGAGAEVVDVTSVAVFDRVDVDNIRIDGNTIISTNTNGNIALTPNGTGEVDISKVDIDGGTIDGTVIGGSTPAAISGTTGSFSGNLTVDTNTLFVDAANNRVGVGTTSVSGILSVNGSMYAGPGSVSGVAYGFYPSSTYGNTGMFSPAANTVAFATTGGERVRIDSSGNVGIGTSSPTHKLTVGGYSNADAANKLAIGDNAGYQALIYMENANETLTIENTSDYAGRATIFKDNGTERMRIDSSGNLLVGTTSSPTGSTGGSGFTAESDARRLLRMASTTTSSVTLISFLNPNGVVGGITTSGSSTSYLTSSDYRLKEDVQPMVGASDRLMALKPVNFAWKADGSRVDGFLAHEAQEVVPQAVTGEKDGEQMQAIDHSKLVPLLTAALQEALTKIETLEARLNALEGQ